MATRKAAGLLDRSAGLPDTFWYSTKRKLLGPPLVNQDLGEQRLSNPLALGVLSPDGISSSAYGTEEILIALVPYVGLAAFTLILPMTLVILFVMVLVLLSYREIVMVYIRPGGSYVVARENFGPRVAQVCAVALLIDYVVTVAVQIAAGTAAVASAFPAIGPYKLEICVGVVLLMCFGNLRGLKEAGRAFAVPTYLFAGSVILMIVVGLIREVLGNLHAFDPQRCTAPYDGSGSDGLLTGAMIFVLLKAFANGGASLTGIEAVSDAVGAFRPPEGRNARKVLMTEGAILGILIAGISWLAHPPTRPPTRRATRPCWPRRPRPSSAAVHRARAVLPAPGRDHADPVHRRQHQLQRLPVPDQLRGGRLVPAPVAAQARAPAGVLQRHHLADDHVGALLIIKDADVNNLVPLYAIGVFTAFTIASFGMARYHSRHRQPGWRYKLVINFSAGVMTLIVVGSSPW